MNKTTKRILIVIGILALVAVFALSLRNCSKASSVVASNPAYISEVPQQETLETIADENVPLAGTNGAEIIPLASVVTPVVDEPAPAAATPTPFVPTPSPEVPTPSPEVPTPTPKTSTATRMLERANTLLANYYACKTAEEKRALLGITNNNFSNDSFRAKILADLGGTWEQLEDEIVDATQYQQGKTLYVQVYMSGLGSDYVPVVYSTQNAALNGSQWSTNLVYNDETALWMEHTQKHPYNDSRVGFGMTSLGNNEDGYEELKDTMETSPVWEEVVVPDSPAPVGP